MEERLPKLIWFILWMCFLFPQLRPGLEIHFEHRDGGFFIRSNSSPVAGQQMSPTKFSAERHLEYPDAGIDDLVLNSGDTGSGVRTHHFTVLPSSQPVSIRVTYGPFSTKQTVPVRLLVPDLIDSEQNFNGTITGETDMIPPLDLSAHLVTPTIPKDTPILRVLFHAGQTTFGLPIPVMVGGNTPRGSRQQQGPSNGRRHRTRLCLVAQATKSQGDTVTSSCSPDAHDSTCLAELTLPIHWWPDGGLLPTEDNGSSAPVKPTKIPIQVSYSVYEPENGHCNEIGLSTTYGYGIIGEGSGTKRIQIQPPTPIATAILINAQMAYRIVKADASEAVKLLVPQGALYPHAKFYVPVTVGKHEHHSIVAFIMRARVKSGIRIIGIEPNIDKMWNITTDFNPRRTHATITAVRTFDPRFQEENQNGEEVFNWILEATEEAGDDWDGGRVVWILRYVIQPSSDTSWMKKDPFSNFGDERHKLTTKLEVQKDDIQAVLPIAKSWEVVNTAILDGKQVSRPMKVFIVSRAGQVADVTLQASCKSLDESVLKVSSSCTSVYVDGSEIRGSTNASILIKYGTYDGQATFKVWMPEVPLEIQLSDNKLNQIKGWRVPNGLSSQAKREVNLYGKEGLQSSMMMKDSARKFKSTNFPSLISEQKVPNNVKMEVTGESENGENYEYGEENEDEDGGEMETGGDDDVEIEEDKFHCRLSYQHSRIDVFTRFLASDHDSGRTSYFISRKTYLKVTDLISDYLRVADSQVAIVKGSVPYVQGLSAGRTEVQIVSPVTGRVLGSKEVRVVNEKVSIASMNVDVISGVQLSLYPDTDFDNQFIAETTITSKLSAKYQEALLDIRLRFSDSAWVKLDEVERENYVLAVDSLEPSVVELPPIQNSKYPRILAVSEGGGPIMRVSLELSDQCHRQNSQPLAMSVAQVEVNFTTSPSRSEFTQNDSNQGLVGNSKQSFRKAGRAGKERSFSNTEAGFKKDSKLFGLSSTSDMTGIPLKDDGSRASRPSSQNLDSLAIGYSSDKSWSFAPRNKLLEIAMYVLLGVFSVAILVFVASCVVYASRVKKREINSGDDLDLKFGEGGNGGLGLRGRTMPMIGTGGGGYMSGTNAHDWVWLGRASLALHPSLDSRKHQASKSVTFEPNGVRITQNPNYEQRQLGSPAIGSSPGPITPYPLNRMNPSESEGRPLGRSGVTTPSQLPPRLPKPTSLQTQQGPVDSTTFSKSNKSDGSPPEGPPPDYYRPPVPPHRNIKGPPGQPSLSPIAPPPPPTTSPPRSATNSTKSNSSNHRRHHQSRKDSGGVGSHHEDSFPEFEFDDTRGYSRDNEAKGIILVRNPMCYIDEEAEEDFREEFRKSEPLTVAAAAAAKRNHRVKPNCTDNVKLNMDYDQLMEYFDSLKETEA